MPGGGGCRRGCRDRGAGDWEGRRAPHDRRRPAPPSAARVPPPRRLPGPPCSPCVVISLPLHCSTPGHTTAAPCASRSLRRPASSETPLGSPPAPCPAAARAPDLRQWDRWARCRQGLQQGGQQHRREGCAPSCGRWGRSSVQHSTCTCMRCTPGKGHGHTRLAASASRCHWQLHAPSTAHALRGNSWPKYERRASSRSKQSAICRPPPGTRSWCTSRIQACGAAECKQVRMLKTGAGADERMQRQLRHLIRLAGG